MATSNWSGVTGDWDEAGEWSGTAVPNASDANAVIDQGTGPFTLTVDAGQSYQLDTLVLDFAGAVLDVEGALDFTGPDHTVTIDAGTVQLGAAGTLSSNADVTLAAGGTLDIGGTTQVIGNLAGVGTVALESGTLDIGGDNTNTTFSGTISAASLDGNVDKFGTGTLTLDGVSEADGSFYVADGTLASVGTNSIDYFGVGEGANAVASGSLADGTLAIGNATPNSGAAFQLGDFGGTGTFDQTGGTLTVGGSFNIGNQGGTGFYNLAGGTLILSIGLYDLGHNNGSHSASQGTLTISGGLLDIASGNMIIGDREASNSAEGTGLIEQTGGVLEVEATSGLFLSAFGRGEYDLDGGTLEVGGQGLSGNYSGGASYIFNLGGGTIAVEGSLLTTDVNATLVSGTTSTLDLDGLGAAFTGILSGSGNLSITGTGTARFADLDTAGTVTLGGGTLDLSSGTADQVGALNGSGTIILGNAALGVGADNGDSTFTGLIETGTTEQGGLIGKTGTGSLTLDDVVMNPGTNNSGLYIEAGSLIESTGSSSLFYLAVGEGAGDTASATLSGGSLTIGSTSASALQIGDFGGTGTFTQTGGTLTIEAGSLNIGNQGGSGRYLISDGTLSFQGGIFDIGRQQNSNIGSTGTLSISGGLVDIADGQLVLGTQYTPNLAGSSGTIEQTGGELRIESGTNFYLTGQGGSQGLYDLDGGTLSVGSADLGPGGGVYAFNLGGGTIAVEGSLLTTGVSATLVAATASTLDLNGFGATFNGAITGSGNLDIVDAGTATFSDLDTTGVIDLEGDTLAIAAGSTSAVGGITGNGTLQVGGTLDLTNGGTATLGGLAGSGTLSLGVSHLQLGADNASSLFSGTVTIGQSGTLSGEVDKLGTGSLTLNGASIANGALYVEQGAFIQNAGATDIYYLAIGEGVGSTASASLSGGTLTLSNALQIGDWGGTGTFVQTAGTLAADYSVNIGNQGGTGTYDLEGGTLLLGGSTANLYDLGHNSSSNPASKGTLNISGGLLDLSKGELVIGDLLSAPGDAGSGTIAQTGGVLRVESGTLLTLSGDGAGAYDLSGGVLEIGGTLRANFTNGAGDYAFNLGGGTIQAYGAAFSTGVNAALVAGTTSTLDVNGFGAAFSGVITGSGDLDIVNAGTATFSDLDTTGVVDLDGDTLDIAAGTTSSVGGITGSGTLQVDGTLDLTNGGTSTLAGLAGAGTLSLGLSDLQLVGNADSLFSGTVAAAGGEIDKLGAGSLTLDNATISGGALDVMGGSLAVTEGASAVADLVLGDGADASASLSGGALTVDTLQLGQSGGTGLLTLIGGVLAVDQSLSLGQGTFDLDGGTLEIGGASLVASGSDVAFNLGGGSIAVTGTALSTSVNTTLIAGETSTLNLNGLGASFSGVVTGAGELDITGSGTATFHDLDMTGVIDVDNGATLDIAGAGSAGRIVVNSGTLLLNPGAALSATLAGGSGASVLELAEGSGIGLLGGLGSTVTDFTSVAIDAGASWELTGSNTLASGTAFSNNGTLTLDDATLDAAGALANNGQIILDPSSLSVAGLTGTGSVTIDSGSTFSVSGSVSAGQTIHFATTDGVLGLADPTNFAGTISGFATDDDIDLTAVAYDAAGTALLDAGTDLLTIAENGVSYELQLTGDYTGQYFHLAAGVTGTVLTTNDEIACYRRGTRILTDRGEVAIEDLAVGDRVVTAAGGTRPILWLGHRRLDIAGHPKRDAITPILVQVDAFGDGMPKRDLWLSPGHNVAVAGALMPISALQNGRTIVQMDCDSVEYWHVELDAHDIILAEGLAAESYLDTGNRTGFANGGAFVEAHPDFAPKHWRETCLPLVQEGPEMERAKVALLARAKLFGHATTTENAMQVIADGARIAPMTLSAKRFAFVVPAGCVDITLRSRSFVPAHMQPSSADHRSLGLCVMRLQIDGETIALDEEARFSEGWHSLERPVDFPPQRWTRGATKLPAGARLIMLDLAGQGYYWDEPEETVAVLLRKDSAV